MITTNSVILLEIYYLDSRDIIRGKPQQPGKEKDFFEDVLTQNELTPIFRERQNKFGQLIPKIKNFIEGIQDLVERAYVAKKKDIESKISEQKKNEKRKTVKILKRYKINYEPDN